MDKIGVAPFLEQLRCLYTAMDRNYTQAADYYGFDCNACKDNCCQTRFYHHTHIEYLFILKGFETLGPEKRGTIKHRAMDVCRQAALADESKKKVRLMCPLNSDNRCALYAYRPMICRLHGIPHEFQKTAHRRIYGPGCEMFEIRCSQKAYFRFDRTPFYLQLADLENKFKKAAGIAGKFKMTLAQMLMGT